MYGPDDATATLPLFLFQAIQIGLPSLYWVVPEKGPLNECCCCCQGPVGYIAVPASRTADVSVCDNQYVNIVSEKVTSVDRRRRRSTAGVTLRRRSVAAVDRDRRPVSYRDVERPQTTDFVTQDDCRYVGSTPDGVKSM